MVSPSPELLANLRTISLASIDLSDPASPVFEDFRQAIFEDGFLMLTDHGLSEADIARQFELADMLMQPGAVTDEEKERLRIDMEGKGHFAGYKPRGLKQMAPRVMDNYEGFDFYKAEFEDDSLVPVKIVPYLPEMRGFVRHVRRQIQPKIYTLLSRLLELPDDYLTERISDIESGDFGLGHFHHTLYHPKSVEELEKGETVAFVGHKDFGLATYLLSQPIRGLQVLKDGKWRWVQHVPGGIIVNLGEVMEYVSGGHLPATQHRVTDPPRYQWGWRRFAVGYFSYPKANLPLEPIKDSPLLQREGLTRTVQSAGQAPTAEQYRDARIRSLLDDKTKEIVQVNGVPYRREVFGSFTVLEAV